MHSKLMGIMLVLFISGFLVTPITVGEDDAPVPMRELLLFQEIPVVTTPAKVEQTILESPSTVTVLTKEDIRRYGITSFSDILRNVPGVDVLSISHTDRKIGIRGSSQFVPSTVLSFVNNTPTYLDFYGMTLWEFLPVPIDEIEKIEIMRGPGSSLYGANAFNGIINVITNSTLADIGTRMSARMDHSGKLGGSMIHVGKTGDLNYRASAEWRKISGWDNENTDTGEEKNFNANLNYSIDSRSYLHFSGGIHKRQFNFTPSELPEFDPIRNDVSKNYLKLNYSRSSLKYSIFWNRDSSTPEFGFGTGFEFKSDSVDNEIQHSFQLLDSNFITWGLNHRFNQAESSITGGQNSQNLWAGYIQDQIKLSRALAITVGLRYDMHPLTGDNFSPRVSFVYSPGAGHAFRASVGRAFQNPPFIYSYVSMNYETSMPMFPVPINVGLEGNKELSPEWLTSHEIGYQGVFGSRFRGGIDLFANHLRGLTELYALEKYPQDALFPGSPGDVIPAIMSIHNNRDVKIRGGEANAEFLMTQWLTAYANYSYQRINDANTWERIESAPKHKINSGLSTSAGQSILISLFANYVGKTIWNNTEIAPYTMINSVISYRQANVDITLSISNILNNRHKEHPEGAEVGRSMTLRLIYQP